MHNMKYISLLWMVDSFSSLHFEKLLFLKKKKKKEWNFYEIKKKKKDERCFFADVV